MILVTCHGNGSSNSSWNYVKACLPEHSYKMLSYDSKNGFENNLALMIEVLNEVLIESPEETFLFLGHSLGGIYCGYLAAKYAAQAVGVVTLATPWAGSEAAPVLGMFAPCQLFTDISPHSNVIRHLARTVIKCAITSVVTTSGQSSLWVKLNDGVISRESMYARKGAKFVEVYATHSEILLNDEAVKIINSVIENSILESV